MTLPAWKLSVEYSQPLVVTAIHNGHAIRDEVAAIMALSEADRLREEDPFTGDWAGIAGNRVVGLRSRFEVDLNRPRDKAVYLKPEDAWGLQVWREKPSPELVARSLAIYDAFYTEIEQVFAAITRQFGQFVVFDLHTYNHRRAGPNSPPSAPEQNPEVNVGTGTMDRARWAPVVEQFIAGLQTFDFLGRRLDVRENVKFRGGQFARWTHQTFPESACVLAIEFKKFFMDEWTGRPDPIQLQAIRRALQAIVPGVLEALKKL